MINSEKNLKVCTLIFFLEKYDIVLNWVARLNIRTNKNVKKSKQKLINESETRMNADFKFQKKKTENMIIFLQEKIKLFHFYFRFIIVKASEARIEIWFQSFPTSL